MILAREVLNHVTITGRCQRPDIALTYKNFATDQN